METSQKHEDKKKPGQKKPYEKPILKKFERLYEPGFGT